jgi:nitroreductase
MSTTPMTAPFRNPEYEVADIFLNRWSPRAFTGEEIADKTLFSFVEAARWAPSSFNSQPWRFLYAKRGTAWFDTFLGLLNERNQAWAKNASVLLVLVSKTTMTPPGRTDSLPAPHHSFDAGAAWSNFALQATLSGWYAHGIAGFDAGRARTELNSPPEYHIDVAIAVGRRGDKSILPEAFHGGENPNSRKPVKDVMLEGAFPKA